MAETTTAERNLLVADERKGLALTCFSPGCWMWQTEDGNEGVAGTREQAIAAARAADAETEQEAR